jgi:hypothetical protein
MFVGCQSSPYQFYDRYSTYFCCNDYDIVVVVVRHSGTTILFLFLFFCRHFLRNFWSITPIDSDLNKVLLVISLQHASKDSVAAGLPMCVDLEDFLTDMADDNANVEATFRLVVNIKIVTDIDIHRVVFVFDWVIANIIDPHFAWANFTQFVYVADNQSQAVAKAANTTLAAPSTSTAPVISTIDFSNNVLTADAKWQVTPDTPGMTVTLKPPFVVEVPVCGLVP